MRASEEKDEKRMNKKGPDRCGLKYSVAVTYMDTLFMTNTL